MAQPQVRCTHAQDRLGNVITCARPGYGGLFASCKVKLVVEAIFKDNEVAGFKASGHMLEVRVAQP